MIFGAIFYTLSQIFPNCDRLTFLNRLIRKDLDIFSMVKYLLSYLNSVEGLHMQVRPPMRLNTRFQGIGYGFLPSMRSWTRHRHTYSQSWILWIAAALKGDVQMLYVLSGPIFCCSGGGEFQCISYETKNFTGIECAVVSCQMVRSGSVDLDIARSENNWSQLIFVKFYLKLFHLFIFLLNELHNFCVLIYNIFVCLFVCLSSITIWILKITVIE